MRATSTLLCTALVCAGLWGCSGSSGGDDDTDTDVPIIDLRADANRDGVVDLEDPADDEGEDVWDASHGAIFMANIDDDLGACSKDASQTDEQLAACNDAADEVVNGTDDLADMARLLVAPWPGAPEDASAKLVLSTPGASYVRLFIDNAGSFELFPPSRAITAAELREGVELALEGKDVVRDDTVWDGYIDVTLEVDAGTASDGTAYPDGSDTVRLRIAPILTTHHLQPAQTLFVSKLDYPEYYVYRDSIQAAVSAADIPNGLVELDVIGEDVWTQDFFEAGYMTMPAAGGQQHVISVFMRSASNWGAPAGQLRPSGKLVFTYFRGKDAAGLMQRGSGDGNGLDDGGNLETIPPYEYNGQSYPFGRIVRGSTPAYHPTESFDRMLASQKIQTPVAVDTSWLAVGHIDETMTYLKTDSPRGWILLANDPNMAIQMLQDASDEGHGAVELFVGMSWSDDATGDYIPANISIDAILADPDLMAENAQAAIDVADQVDTIKAETGITDAEIVPVPFLHWEQYGASAAYQPGTTNGIALSDTDYGAPEPHGPVIDGHDVFKVQLEDALAPHGIEVRFIEDWEELHMWTGEVHCGSNTIRAVPADVRWWESGR
ncbi:MAG: protein-arginine deiminase family protein [Deltaproteobacteria bacterium]|nr:protein-arginine deiminase family protein [Deltaproteobacteria bacterium]